MPPRVAPSALAPRDWTGSPRLGFGRAGRSGPRYAIRRGAAPGTRVLRATRAGLRRCAAGPGGGAEALGSCSGTGLARPGLRRRRTGGVCRLVGTGVVRMSGARDARANSRIRCDRDSGTGPEGIFSSGQGVPGVVAQRRIALARQMHFSLLHRFQALCAYHSAICGICSGVVRAKESCNKTAGLAQSLLRPRREAPITPEARGGARPLLNSRGVKF